MEPSGLLLLDKDPGWTSHDVVNKVRRLLGTRRVGHCGTLDPAATGLLVLCLGQATRLVEYLGGCDKDYTATVVLGVLTDSYDATGEVVETRPAGHLTQPAVEAVLPLFRGAIDQVPPMASAKKIDGQTLHRLHRQGRVVERAAAPVHISRLDLTRFEAGEQAQVGFEITCGAGTYIRSLAHDLGLALGVGGHLATLRRTRVGEFQVTEAVRIEALEDLAPAARLARLLPPERSVAHLPSIHLRDEDLLALRQGKRLPPASFEGELPAAGPVAVFGGDRLLAIGEPREGELQPRKVLV